MTPENKPEPETINDIVMNSGSVGEFAVWSIAGVLVGVGFGAVSFERAAAGDIKSALGEAAFSFASAGASAFYWKLAHKSRDKASQT